MADTKISALPAATTPLAGTEVLPVVQGGTTDKVSVANLTAGRRIGTAGMDAAIGGSAHGVRVTGVTGGNQDFWAVRNGSNVIQEGPNITLQSATGTTYASTMQMGPTGNTLFFMYDGAAWNQRFAMTTAGSLAISTSGQGIDFSATPGTGTSELLADYEEGTFTPSLVCGTSGTITLDVRNGFYTKIGNVVQVFAYFNVLSVASPVGELRLSGLPFAVGSTLGRGGSFSIFAFGLSATATTSLVGLASAGNSYAVLSKYASGGVAALSGDVVGGAGMYLSFSYTV